MTHKIEDAVFVILPGDEASVAFTRGFLGGQESLVLVGPDSLDETECMYAVLLEAGERPHRNHCRHAVMLAIRDGLDFVAAPASSTNDFAASTATYAEKVAGIAGSGALSAPSVMRVSRLRAAVATAPARTREALATHVVSEGLALDWALAPLATRMMPAASSLRPTEIVDVWRWQQEMLSQRGVDHLHDGIANQGLPNLLHRLIWEIDDPSLREEGWNSLRNLAEGGLPQVQILRHQEVLDAVAADDRVAFDAAIRLRMLVAGHDLKFIDGLFGDFREFAELEIDKWDGRTGHDEGRSIELGQWADLIFAEWLLGAAEFHSHRVAPHQRMVIRTHRVDMTAEFGLTTNWDNVSKVIAIAPHTLHDFVDRFDIPREKMVLIPNWFEVEAYETSSNPDRVFKLAMVGSLPKLKGLQRAYELLKRLRAEDERYELCIFGKRPEELSWLMGRTAEREYYEAADRYVKEQGLEQHVHQRGWVDTKTGLGDIGFVLSLSDFEGMQVAVGEAYCVGAVGLMLNWRGADRCYPSEFVFESIEGIAQFILEHQDPARLEQASARGRDFVIQRYDKPVIVSALKALIANL